MDRVIWEKLHTFCSFFILISFVEDASKPWEEAFLCWDFYPSQILDAELYLGDYTRFQLLDLDIC